MQNVQIEGQKIVEVRPLTRKEIDQEGWTNGHTICLILENGAKLYPSRDYEGNDGGALFGTYNGDSFAI